MDNFVVRKFLSLWVLDQNPKKYPRRNKNACLTELFHVVKSVSCAFSIFPLTGYANLFKPIMQSVVNHYQPSCIVLQVRITKTFSSSFSVLISVIIDSLLINVVKVWCCNDKVFWSVNIVIGINLFYTHLVAWKTFWSHRSALTQFLQLTSSTF